MPGSPSELTTGRVIDPRPDATVAASTEAKFSDFFDTTTYAGAFAPTGDTWLTGWSYLDCVQGTLVKSASAASCTDPNGGSFAKIAASATASATNHVGDITTSETWAAGNHVLAGQVFVKSGVTLTIAAGATIYGEKNDVRFNAATALPGGVCSATACTAANYCIFDATASTCTPFTSVLVIEKGAKIVAVGTAAKPITFTANLAKKDLPCTAGSCKTVTDSTTGKATSHGSRGNWGGLIILGEAPVKGGPAKIEGLSTPEMYGGTKPADNSGSLKYVRVWHGGAAIAADNEINGITFGGVGSGTTVEYCEVALNVDDGFEFFGGTVNAKYLSTLFVGDDAFDTDKGYKGSMQYLYAMIGNEGNHGCEMDGNNADATKSAPSVMGMTLVGCNSNVKPDSLLRLREATAGRFANVLLAKRSGTTGIRNDQCTGMATTQTRNLAATKTETELYVSPKTIMNDVPSAGAFNDKCVAAKQLSKATQPSVNTPVFKAMPGSPSELTT